MKGWSSCLIFTLPIHLSHFCLNWSSGRHDRTFDYFDIITGINNMTWRSAIYIEWNIMIKIYLGNWPGGSIKGHLRSKKKLSSNERAWKMQKKTSHYRHQCAKWFSRYSISKSGIWARWISPFCRFSASFSIKYDLTDAILQDNEKMKVQYLRSLLLDCLKVFLRPEVPFK